MPPPANHSKEKDSRTNHPALKIEEDNSQYRLIYCALQQTGAGCRVCRACDAATAIDYLSRAVQSSGAQEHPLPRLILLDAELPNRNAFDVIEMVRGEPALHGIVVIMLGFPGEPEEIKRAYELGVNSYVVKPPFEAYNYLFAAIHRYWLRCNEQPDWLVHSSSGRRKSDACTDFARAS